MVKLLYKCFVSGYCLMVVTKFYILQGVHPRRQNDTWRCFKMLKNGSKKYNQLIETELQMEKPVDEQRDLSGFKSQPAHTKQLIRE